MTSQQVYSAPSHLLERGDGEETETVSKRYGDGLFSAVTLRGRPVDKSRTGRMSAAKYVYALTTADYTAGTSVTVSLVFYLYTYLHQTVSNGATIANNYTGTFFLLTVLGGFLADSYLGHYITIIIGSVIQMLGMGLLIFSSSYSGLQPPACTATLTTVCPPAGGKYMAPLYVALYTIALGTGFVKSCTPALGAEQFDESDPIEQKQSVHFFIYYYFFQNVGVLISFTLSVYILNYVSKDWGFAWLLIFYSVAFVIFLAGTRQYRHKRPAGSFLTRVVQVAVATLRKRSLQVPNDDDRLFDVAVSGGWLKRTRNLRILDMAATLEKDEDTTNRWKLVGVTQVEETKRILLIIPVWVCTWVVSIIFSQVTTFTATQGATLNRNLGPHFVVPAQSLGVALFLFSLAGVPVYDQVVRPILRKWTKNPYGITPLKRIGIALLSASVAMVIAAVVEKKRLRYVRDLGYTQAVFFVLPMKMWWLLPQYFFSSLTELFLLVGMYEFFYHEVSDNTRSIGSSFSFSSLSMGYYFSSVLVNITNDVTRSRSGGRWLVERLNDGGLESYYWLLAVIQAVNFIVFLVAAYLYKYNYTIYLPPKKTEDGIDEQRVD